MLCHDLHGATVELQFMLRSTAIEDLQHQSFLISTPHRRE